MRTPPFQRSSGLLVALLSACLATVAQAQKVVRDPAASQNSPAAITSANDALLARAAKLYYSTAKTGLEGFDCALHPDWRTLFASAGKETAVPADDPRIVMMNSVKMVFHARLNGNSTVGWEQPANADKPLDQDSTALLDGMHQATTQTLQGFMQFWTPFVNGSVVPATSEGLTISRTDTGYTMDSDQSGVIVTEVLDNQLLLHEFNVKMSSATIKFSPAYEPTPQGLLVNGFQAHILPVGASPEQAQQMRVAIEYQTLDGFPIPAKLNMSVSNSGEMNFVLDGCTVNPK